MPASCPSARSVTQRTRLEDIVAGELVFPVRRLAENGLEAWAQVIERGCEGYVAKNERSHYEGGATRRWLKVAAGLRSTTPAELELNGPGRRLRAALAAVLVRDSAPELRLIHDWLDSWSGIGLIVVGMSHPGFMVNLGEHGAGRWIAVLVAAAATSPWRQRGRRRSQTVARGPAGGVGGVET
jgi:hypothetical protein